MLNNPFVYTFSIVIVCSYVLSGIYIAAVRGFKPPITYMLLYRFAGALLATLNIVQTSHSALSGQILWNPIHVLMLLTLYPLLFIYVFGMLRPGSAGGRLLLLTFLPAAVLTALYFAFDSLYGTLPLFATYADLRNFLDRPQLWVLFAAVGISIAMMSFMTIRATGMLRQHKRDLKQNFSYTEGSTLGWMWWAIGLTLFKWSVMMIVTMVEGGFGQLLALFFFPLEPTITTVLAVRQKDLYSVQPSLGAAVALENNTSDKTSEQPSKKREALKNLLLSLLEKDEIFLNPELNSDKICAMLTTNRTYLSQMINQDMDTTFYQLINTFRLNKAVGMMRNPLNHNMALRSISEICGFKSLSAFCIFFKQVHGKTPTEWMKETEFV